MEDQTVVIRKLKSYSDKINSTTTVSELVNILTEQNKILLVQNAELRKSSESTRKRLKQDNSHAHR